MFLWWGPELICFYNDAYRPSLGTNGKHPHILGEPAREAWPEIWPIIHPMIDQVLKGGESTWSEDQLIPIYSNGKIENVYWTFSYSPVTDENDTIAGLLVTCFETTEKVLSRNQFHKSVMQAPVAICIFRGPEYIIEMANEKMLELWGKKREKVLNRRVFEGVYEAANQGFEQILHSVYTKGDRFSANDTPVRLSRNGVATQVYVNLLYEPLREDDGTITGIVAVATEVTDTVLAKKKLQDTEERARLAIKAGQLGTFDLNIVTGEIIGSNRFHELFGMDPSNRHQDYFSTIHPEDFPAQQAAFATALQTGKLSYETRIIWQEDYTTSRRLTGQTGRHAGGLPFHQKRQQ